MFNTTLTEQYGVIPFDDTLVLYNPHDPLSILSVYLSLSPILLLTFYLSWLIITRELESIIVAGGQLINEFINKVLKRIIKEPRPYVALMGPGYGMPSAHSQFMGFFTSYWSLKLWIAWYNPRIKTRHKLTYTLYFMLYSFAVCGSRVYLRYHSVEQVTLGFLIGIFNGCGYFLVVGILRHLGLMNHIVHWQLATNWYIIDSWHTSPATTLHDQYSRDKSTSRGLKFPIPRR